MRLRLSVTPLAPDLQNPRLRCGKSTGKSKSHHKTQRAAPSRAPRGSRDGPKVRTLARAAGSSVLPALIHPRLHAAAFSQNAVTR